MSVDIGTISGKVQFDVATNALTDAIGKLADVATALSHTGDRAKDSGSTVETAYRKLAASLDPVVAGQQKYERAQQTLDAALAKGVITQEQYSTALDRANEKFLSTEHSSTSLREKLDELAHSVQGFGEHLNELGEKFESVKQFGEGLKEKLLELAAVIGAGLSLDKIIEDTVASQDAQAQLAAGLRSVGAATGETREKLEALTNSLAGTTKFSRTTIEQAESLGLTFTHISADAFPRFLQAAADISARTGEDLPAAVEKLGRALDTGMVAPLKRAGITFDQTAQAQAKFFAETGQYSKSISLILGGVEAKLAGSAEAARNTLGGALQLLRNEFEEVAISIGTQISPALVALTKEIETLARSDQFKTLAADIGSFLVTAIHELGAALQFLAEHLEAVKEIAASILLVKLALWLKEVAEAEIIAGLASLSLGAALEAVQVLGFVGGLQYMRLVLLDATVALRAFVAQAIAASAALAPALVVIAGIAYTIRQYTIEQQAASEAMLKQLSLLGQARAAFFEARQAIEAVTQWQQELDRARSAGDPARIAAAERNLAAAHQLVTQELKDRVQATGSALVAEEALAKADLDHAKQLAGQKVFYPAGPQRDVAIAANKDVQDAEGRVKNLGQQIKKLGDEYVTLSKIPVVSEQQKTDIPHFAEHFNSAAQAVQAYADKIFDLTTKLLDNGANQSKLLSALGESEIAYNLQKAAIERSTAIEQTALQIKTAHRELEEKLRSEVEKATAALSQKHGVDQEASAAIRDGNAALEELNKNYPKTIEALTALAAKNVDLAQAEKARLFILQDNRAASEVYGAENARLEDAVHRTTLATQAHSTQLAVEHTLLAASKQGIADLDGSIEANVRARLAQTNALRVQIDIQRQLNALSDQTLNVKAAIEDWNAQREAVLKYGAEIAGILKQYGLLSAATQERTAEEAYLRELEKGASFDQAKQLYDAIKGQQEIVNGLYAVQAATEIASLRYKEFADQLAQNYAGIFAEFIKTGKLSLDSFETATVDAFASVAEKVIQNWLTQWFEAMAEWLVRWIATQSAAKAAEAGLGSASGSSSGGSSWLSLLATAYKIYAGYSGAAAGAGGAGLGGGASTVGGGYYATGAGNFGGGYGSGVASSGGSGAAGAAWFAAFAYIALDWLKTKGTPWAQSNITFGGNQGLTIGNASANQGGATDHDAKRNVSEALSAASDVINGVRQFIAALGGTIDRAQKEAASQLSIQKHGQGSSTDWIVTTFSGQIQHFGKDVAAAEQFAVLDAIKHVPIVGVPEEVKTVIKNTVAGTVDALNSDMAVAISAVQNRLGTTGSQEYGIITKYRQETDAETRLGLSIDATVAARNRESDALKNQLLGIDTSLADNIAAILSFNRGIEEAAVTLTGSIQSVLGMTIEQAKTYLAQYQSLLDQYHLQKGTPPGGGAKNAGEGTPAQWVDALGNVADTATQAILAKLGPLKDALDQYAKELGKLPEEITKEQLEGSIFFGLLKYVKDATVYEADREKFARLQVDAQFKLLEIQIKAAGLWEDLAALFNDAYNNAVNVAITPPEDKPKKQNTGSSGPTPAQQLADFFAAFDRAQLPALAGQIADINKKYDDEIKATHATGDAVQRLNTYRTLEIDKAKEQARASAVGSAQGFIDSALPDLVKQINAVHTGAQGLIDGLRSVAAQGGLSTVELHRLVAAIRAAEQAQIDAVKNGVLKSIDSFSDALGNQGLTGQLKAIADQGDALRASLDALAAAGALSAEEFYRAAGKIIDAAHAQERAAVTNAGNSLLETLYGYLKDDKDLAQLKYDLAVAQLQMDRESLAIAIAKFGLDASILAKIDPLIAKVIAGGADLFASGSGPGAGPDPSKALADYAAQQANAANTLQQAADAFAASTQKLIDYQKSLTISADLSPLTPSQQKAEALSQLQAMFSSALGGSIDARNNFSGIADAFLRLAKSVDPSSLGYGVDFKLVQDMLARLIGQTTYQIPGAQNVIGGAPFGQPGSSGGGGIAGLGPTAGIDLSPVVVSIQAGTNSNHADMGVLAVKLENLTTVVSDQQGRLMRIASYLERRAAAT